VTRHNSPHSPADREVHMIAEFRRGIARRKFIAAPGGALLLRSI
jgi:hypothetical protein